MRILVVEDDESSRRLLEKALKSYGYTVDCASNGARALDITARYAPDLIISDILMPEMDGYTLCREIKKDPYLGNA